MNDHDIITMLRSPARLEPHTCNEAADEIEVLRNARDNARLAYRGASHDRDRMRTELAYCGGDRDRMRAERDRARRLVCELQCDPPERFIGLPHEVAQMYGWDCFAEATP